jgi:hypothetical protein
MNCTKSVIIATCFFAPAALTIQAKNPVTITQSFSPMGLALGMDLVAQRQE